MDVVENNEMKKIVQKHRNLFSGTDEKITYTTIVAEIRANSDTPVYSKSYPYPINLKQEVGKQIKKLLEDGIIRQSRSPYNSPLSGLFPNRTTHLAIKNLEC